MDNAIYVALSRQTELFRKLSVNANNLANTNTLGYQSQGMMFTDYVMDGGNRTKVAYTQDMATYRDTRGGSIKVTGNPLDLAISGKGYFRVETPGGERYTRAGNFQIDGAGVIVTPEGFPVLDNGGQRIVLNPDDTKIEIRGDGSILADGDVRGEIGVAQFANDQLLERTSGTLLKSSVPPVEGVEEYGVVQGALESSNVQPVIELTQMIELQRGVANTAKYVETVNELERKAINAYGKPLAA